MTNNTTNNLTSWGQFLIALVTMLVIGTLAYGDVRAEISMLKQRASYVESNIEEIKNMLRAEIERHHPRPKLDYEYPGNDYEFPPDSPRPRR